jgi:hypothetical protein
MRSHVAASELFFFHFLVDYLRAHRSTAIANCYLFMLL